MLSATRNRTPAAALALLILLVLAATPAWAQDSAQMQKANEQAGGVFGFILKTLVMWIFPAMGLLCALYGLGRGMRRGEWDFFAMCLIAAILIALTPTVLEKVMGLDFSKMMR